MSEWVVDGMNVVGSTPDGWWRDRRGAMRRLARDLAAFAAQTGEHVTVVFDGAPFAVEAEPVDVRFAAQGGRNAADDVIARLVGEAELPGSITVVTSDRDLVQRVRAHGAEVMPARTFRNSIRSVP
jgi:predicted RNA-binding protein with PIN domain